RLGRVAILRASLAIREGVRSSMVFRARTWLLFLSTTLVGCVGLGIHLGDEPKLLDGWEANAIGGAELSPRSLQTLRQLDLEPVYHRRPSEAFKGLQVFASQEPRPDYLFALAELAHLLGRQSEKSAGVDACAYYYLCAGYAYHYLFDNPGERAGTPEQ